MDWREELARIDADLAAGTLSPADHRRQRDEILAAASSAPMPVPAMLTAAEKPPADPDATQVIANAAQVRGPEADWPGPPASTSTGGVTTVTPTEAREIFTTRPPARRPWVVPVVGLVVLVLATAVVWWWQFDGDRPRPGAGAPTPTFESFQPPGELDSRNGPLTIHQAAQQNLVTAREAELLTARGFTDARFIGSARAPYQYLVYEFTGADDQTAAARAESLRAVQREIGFVDISVDGLPGQVHTVEISNAKAAQVRATYRSGTTTVQLAVLQVPRGDPGELRGELRDLVTKAALIAPPG